MTNVYTTQIAVEERRDSPGVWTVEAIGSDGEIYQAIFYGPDSEGHAFEYALLKYGFQNATSATTSLTHV